MTIPSRNAGEYTRTKQTPSDSSSPEWLKGDGKKLVIAYFGERFGVPSRVFEPYRVYERNKGIWLLRDSRWLEIVERLPVDSAGLMVLRRLDRGFKPTTVALQLFGRWIRKNVVVLTEEEFHHLILNRELELESVRSCGASRGYVAIKIGELVAGCSFFKADKLISQLPKSFASIKFNVH